MIQERITVGKDTKYPLNGLLTLPDDISRPVPAVVLMAMMGTLGFSDSSRPL